MAFRNLTSEQEAVVYHPRGQHARVLAVAGSGKTTTLTHRIKHLVMEQHVPAKRIRVLMFNRLAQRQFVERLHALGLPHNNELKVNTFHSFAINCIDWLVKRGELPPYRDVWAGSKEELIRLHVKYAIRNLSKAGLIAKEDYDVEEILEAIGLWKGALIPPERAGHYRDSAIAAIFREFERMRREQQALTYDDFIPLLVQTLDANENTRHQIAAATEFLIVDEYQDVNYGQQRVLEMLAERDADVMVVGDDDQTIYEWRGARPNYILTDFPARFANKPHAMYTLSHSFRFGPLIAQCAENVIRFNTKRIEKPLTAHEPKQDAAIHLLNGKGQKRNDRNRELAHEIVTILRGGSLPAEMIVLARMYSQLSGLETEFLNRDIPYRILGNAPFFRRRESRLLLDYVRAAEVLDEPLTPETIDLIVGIANVPNRWLSRDLLARELQKWGGRGWSLRNALNDLGRIDSSPFNMDQRINLIDLCTLFDQVVTWAANPRMKAGAFFTWLIERLDYVSYFNDYYGRGEGSEDRKRTVQHFVAFAQGTGMSVSAFLDHIATLDPSKGLPDDDVITMTTVFKVKGLEYDYVFIPDCDEGYMPCLYDDSNPVYDTEGLVQEPESSKLIENERRLFYVAVTRAKKAAYIAASPLPNPKSIADLMLPRPSRFICEMELEPTANAMALVRAAARTRVRQWTEAEAALSAVATRKYLRLGTVRYLERLKKQEMIDQIEQAAAKTKDVPFQYPIRYDSTTPVANTTVTRSAKWWEKRDVAP